MAVLAEALTVRDGVQPERWSGNDVHRQWR
jgi:hypothetical protein